MPAHKPFYRPLLKHALQTAWAHRELWPLAAIAGLAGTGAVVNDILNQAKLAASIPTNSFSQAFANLHILGVYRDNVIFASPEQITASTIILLFIAMLVVFAIAACQQIMLRVAHRAAAKKTPLTLSDFRRELMHPRLFRFIGLDLFLKLMVANLMIATTVLLGNLHVGTIISDAVFGTIFSAAAVSLALTLNVVVMLALINVARKDATVPEALTYAWKLYRKHPLICLEMSVLLFAVNFAISAAYDGTILVLGVPAVYSFAAAVQAGSLFGYVALTALATLVVVTVTLIFAGFMTTFTYAAWTALAEHLDKKTLTPRVVIHSQRLVEHLRS
jgi:hypothetical protein